MLMRRAARASTGCWICPCGVLPEFCAFKSLISYILTMFTINKFGRFLIFLIFRIFLDDFKLFQDAARRLAQAYSFFVILFGHLLKFGRFLKFGIFLIFRLPQNPSTPQQAESGYSGYSGYSGVHAMFVFIILLLSHFLLLFSLPNFLDPLPNNPRTRIRFSLSFQFPWQLPEGERILPCMAFCSSSPLAACPHPA